MYVVVKKEDKAVLGTIDINSNTYREFDIPGARYDTSFIILDNDPKNMT